MSISGFDDNADAGRCVVHRPAGAYRRERSALLLVDLFGEGIGVGGGRIVVLVVLLLRARTGPNLGLDSDQARLEIFDLAAELPELLGRSREASLTLGLAVEVLLDGHGLPARLGLLAHFQLDPSLGELLLDGLLQGVLLGVPALVALLHNELHHVEELLVLGRDDHGLPGRAGGLGLRLGLGFGSRIRVALGRGLVVLGRRGVTLEGLTARTNETQDGRETRHAHPDNGVFHVLYSTPDEGGNSCPLIASGEWVKREGKCPLDEVLRTKEVSVIPLSLPGILCDKP